ncbi:carbohydrate ABC transporter permease [Lysinimonas soli]|uniref:Carbohydrate ABC transporter permease n=1 Tax=Lysinimonas soli TaxID=1074233 RepID=A0ABW0NU87_9MICO
MTTTTTTTAASGRPAARRRGRGSADAASRPGFLGYGLLIATLLGAILPLYWAFLIASGDSSSLNNVNLPWWPGGNFLANAIKVVTNERVSFWKAVGNSLIVSTVVAASVVFFSTLAGYAFAKLRFRGRRGLFVFVIATTAVPTQLGVVPLFIVMSQLGWTGTLGAVIVPGLVTAFGVFWMTQYLSTALPDELIEAGRIDGASMIKTFWYIGFPSARPAAAMLGLFTFIATWTNFFWPFIVLDPSNPTLPVALSQLQANYFVDYSIVLAGVLLATLPLLVLFIVAGRQLVAGIMQGAVKG